MAKIRMPGDNPYRIVTADDLLWMLRIYKRYGIAVDIDETLSETNRHWIRCLCEELGTPDGLSADDVVAKYRYIERVPAWQTYRGQELMEEYLTSNDFQETIPVIDGAQKALAEIAKRVNIIAYVTARPEVVATGTAKWLQAHGFPVAPIILRPRNVPFQEKNSWKAGELLALSPFVRGVVDDNPGLIDSLPEGYAGHVFLYDHPGHSREGIKVHVCPTWEHVQERILATF